uniref:Uncharacterized protein n=1 Tax=Anopheles coluzzii TaxID=1518534 RepID=A0A8W7PCB9_ANOCL
MTNRWCLSRSDRAVGIWEARGGFRPRDGDCGALQLLCAIACGMRDGRHADSDRHSRTAYGLPLPGVRAAFGEFRFGSESSDSSLERFGCARRDAGSDGEEPFVLSLRTLYDCDSIESSLSTSCCSSCWYCSRRIGPGPAPCHPQLRKQRINLTFPQRAAGESCRISTIT